MISGGGAHCLVSALPWHNAPLITLLLVTPKGARIAHRSLSRIRRINMQLNTVKNAIIVLANAKVKVVLYFSFVSPLSKAQQENNHVMASIYYNYQDPCFRPE